jgi:hypothetical protein
VSYRFPWSKGPLKGLVINCDKDLVTRSHLVDCKISIKENANIITVFSELLNEIS